jgi:hypothetical protein
MFGLMLLRWNVHERRRSYVALNAYLLLIREHKTLPTIRQGSRLCNTLLLSRASKALESEMHIQFEVNNMRERGVGYL